MSPAVLAEVAGGIGLFLLGMILLTEGLKTAAGDRLRSGMARFVRGRYSAAAAGATVTALVQSSSATTVATIGFVSAGLLTFPQGLGVMIGANLGTTSTGWIVSLLGLKLQIGTLALPLIAVGAVVRLLSTGSRAFLGMALAGFGLIFVGIDVLQSGMAGVAQHLDPSTFPEATWAGGLVLVGAGVVTTVVMQSSSAAVAATLTALHAGTLGLEQAAYLVVGQNLGTTVKAVLASIGASVPARRTAAGHILFNVATGAVAFVILPLLLPALVRLGTLVGETDPAVVIAGFHTAFNLLGVVLFLSFFALFSRLVLRLVPEREPSPTRHLDRSLAAVPDVAVDTVRRTLLEIAGTVMEGIEDLFRGEPRTRRRESQMAEARHALAETRTFLGELETTPESPGEHHRHLALLHALDHLDRLVRTSRSLGDLAVGPEVVEGAGEYASILRRLGGWLRGGSAEGEGEALVALLNRGSRELAERRKRQRAWVLDETARGRISPENADRRMNAMREVDRVAYHVWRGVHHLTGGLEAEGGEEPVGDGQVGEGGEDSFR